MGCVLTDIQLQDLYNALNDNKSFSGIAFMLGDMREHILSALHELQERRKHPDMPDAEELLDIERLDREAQEDALLDTRPRPPYRHYDMFTGVDEPPDDYEPE